MQKTASGRAPSEWVTAGCTGAWANRIEQARQAQRFVIYCVSLTTASEKGTELMVEAQVDEIASRHAALHSLIDEEEHRSHPDEDLLHRLKKEKLRLKDALSGH